VSARSVVVTGTSSGIGRATVLELVSAGFHVFGTVRRETDAEGLRRQFPEVVTPLIMDLLDEDSVRAAGEVVKAAGPLFGLVNNAGAAFPGPLELIPIEVFRRQLEVNLTGQLLVTQVMLPALRHSAETTGDARIIMIGSIGGRIAGPMLGAYSAAKHGLVGLSGSLRAELAPSKIKVMLIEPGAIATPIWNRGRATETNCNQLTRRRGHAMPARSRRGESWQSGVPPRASIRRFRPRSSWKRCRTRVLRRGKWSAGMPKW
jgi:NAD(P)-dependent dehydrogenase (short-subunit alcohol dehydrogenase family)